LQQCRGIFPRRGYQEMKHLAGLLIIFGSILWAQVAPPKHSHDKDDNLTQRYGDLKCAMVTIKWDDTLTLTFTPPPGQLAQLPQPPPPPQTIMTTHFGSGFYVSGDGDIVTAAHVLGNKSWSDCPASTILSPQRQSEVPTDITNSFSPFRA
jgi:hypothetical protein